MEQHDKWTVDKNCSYWSIHLWNAVVGEDAALKIRGFVCTNEVCNVGAANALVDLGLGGKVYVVGCDNSQRQIQFLEQNIIQAIVTQRPFNMGYMAVQQAVRVANGEQTDDFVEVSCVLITRENMYTQENQKLLFPVLR